MTDPISDSERLTATYDLVAIFQPVTGSLDVEAGLFGTLETPEEYEAAARLSIRVKRALDDLSENRLRITRPIDAHKAKIMAAVNPLLESLKETLQHLEGCRAEYRRAEQTRLDQEAEEREARFQNALADGDTAAADEALMEQVNGPARDRAYTPPGTGVGGRWYAEVEDLRALARFAADSGLTSLLLPNQPALNGMASASKGHPSDIPGVVFKKKEWETTSGR